MKTARLIAALVSVFAMGFFSAEASAMYDSVQGRFKQLDPIGYADGLNLYLYVKDNPVSHRDPSGVEVAPWLLP